MKMEVIDGIRYRPDELDRAELVKAAKDAAAAREKADEELADATLKATLAEKEAVTKAQTAAADARRTAVNKAQATTAKRTAAADTKES
jgi:hypothetical protein